MHHSKLKMMLLLPFILLMASAVWSQTTTFTYQGKLTDSGGTQGSYQMEFRLFDSASGGSQIGNGISNGSVAVSDGIFTINLDFGSSAFTGADRFLQIAVRRNSGDPFVTLNPRQQIASSPFSIRTLSAVTTDFALNAATADSLSAACVGCVTNNRISSLDGGKVTGTVANATTAVNAFNLTGSLTGDVQGTQGATTVTRLQGRPVATTQPLAGQVLKYNGTVNQWVPDTDSVASGGGTITGVTPGTGLTGGGATGNVTVGIGNSGVGTNEIANAAVTDAKIAASTITAQKIGNGQVVKGMNGLTDNVTLAAGSNITLTPAGNTLTIASTGGGGIGGSGSTNSIPLWSGGTTLGNSLISQNAAGIFLNDGATVSGLNGDNAVLTARLANSDPFVIIDATTATRSAVLAYRKNNFNRWLMFANGTAEIGGNEGSDFQLDAYNSAGGIANYMFVKRSTGNIGFGTATPNTRLAISGGPSWTSAFWNGSLSMANSSAIGWEANPSGQRFGIGQTAGGLYFFRTNSPFANTSSPANYDLAIQDDGNLTQNRSKAGLAKAMVYVDPFLPAAQYVVRCYNGATNSSTGNCGFTVTRDGTGDYIINFGFQVNDRFLALTQESPNCFASTRPFGTNAVRVTVVNYAADSTFDSKFQLIVY